MLRAALRPFTLVQRTASLSPLAPTLAGQHAALAPMAAGRAYAAKAAAMKKPKQEDPSLEGRYATALFMATSDRIEKVYSDLSTLRTMMKESKELKLVVETPGIDPASKTAAFESICKAAGTDEAVVNFLKVLVENKRIKKLPRMIDLYESFYRAEKGLVLCQVSSATDLSSAQKSAVQDSLQKRAAKGATLVMEYTTNPALLGGLVVKMGEAMLDQSVSTRLERLQNQLLTPIS
jgi:F-type H+-transporting ATPase subunit delta